MSRKLFQTNPFVAAPCGSVGKNDAITFAQTFANFDGANGKSAELDGGACCFGAVRIHFEKANGGFRLAERGAADIENVFHVFDFNGAVDAEVGTSAIRKRAIEGNIDSDRAVLNARVDA